MVVQGKTEPEGLVEPVLVAVDTGGTFTDVVLERPGGQRFTTKLLTTYARPALGLLAHSLLLVALLVWLYMRLARSLVGVDRPMIF